MTIGEAATTARFLTNTDSTSYADAQLLINLNLWYQKTASIIFESQDNSDFDDARNANYPVVTTPIKGGQRDYTMPVSEGMLKIKRVDVCYDGTNFAKAEAFDTGSWPGGIKFNPASSTDTTFDGNFIQSAPRYDVAYNSIWIAPMPSAADETAGGKIRVEWERNVTPFTSAELTTGTAVPGFDAPFHPILPYGAAFEYATSRQLPQLAQITAQLQDYEARIRTAYGRKDLDMRLNLQADYISYR